MEYIVSARKYRPMTFDTVVGQSALTTTLKNAVVSGKLAHAFLFCGPRGVGKTTCARIFAKAINCEHPTPDGEACNECESCKAMNEQRSLNIFELDAASNNSVENMKSLIEQTRIPPQTGRYKVFIIDEVHMLSTAAFNAFLKTLEEPPSYVIFILATTEKHKILPTIISRCQIYDFERMTVQNTISHLKMVAEKEGISYEEDALHIIAEKADGGMRDALSIFDQCVSYCQGNLTYSKVIENLNVLALDNYFNIVDLSLKNQVSDIMVLLNDIINQGFDGGHLINGLASHIRNVLMAKNATTLPLLEVSEQQRSHYREQAQKCPTPFLYDALRILNRCDVNYRQSSNKRLLVELTLIEVAQITQPDDDDTSSGRRPTRRIKPLFQNLTTSAQPTVTLQVATAQRPTPSAPLTPTSEKPLSAPHPVATPKIKLSTIAQSFGRINSCAQKVYQTEPTDKAQVQEQQPFTQDDVEREWYAMCNRMPQKMIGLSSRLKNITPKITDYPHIELAVDNSLLLNDIDSIKGRINATMAKALHHSGVVFHLRLTEKDEQTAILSKGELFDKLRNEKPVFEKLRNALDLELT